MNSEIKTYSYSNGEMQRVQVVRWDDWSQLDFWRPAFSPVSLDCFYDIYRNFLVPACPWIFGQMVMFRLPDSGCEALAGILPEEGYISKKYGVVSDKLTIATIMLQEGMKMVGEKPKFSSQEAETLWRELEKKDCVRIVRGKLPMTQVIPVGNETGYLSGAGDASIKVNSSFFIMDAIDCATIYDQIGTVLGLCVKDGVVHHPPLYDREALLVDNEGRVSIRSVDVRELDIEIHGECYHHGENTTIYTRPEKKKVGTGLWKLVIVGTKVVAVSRGRVDIPASGFVMTVKAGDIKPGDEVIYHGLEHIQFGIQVGNSVIREGVKTQGFISRFYNIYHLEPVPFPPSLYPMDYEKARAARIALGADKGGKPMLFWAEGAAKFGYVPGEGSCGASLSEMAEIAEDLGMVNGINLDGGGSAQILLNGERSLMISDRKKEDHSEAERLIPLGLVVR